MEIVRAGPDRIPELRPLWESLSRHHAEVAPELGAAFGPVRRADESWTVRRDLYEGFLNEPGGFALIAEDGSSPLGYAVVSLRGPEETWHTGPVAELQTLAVLPGHRGRGTGRALVERMFDELRADGIGHFTVSVIASNREAIRFYERLGLARFLVTFAGPVPAASAP